MTTRRSLRHFLYRTGHVESSEWYMMSQAHPILHSLTCFMSDPCEVVDKAILHTVLSNSGPTLILYINLNVIAGAQKAAFVLSGLTKVSNFKRQFISLLCILSASHVAAFRILGSSQPEKKISVSIFHTRTVRLFVPFKCRRSCRVLTGLKLPQGGAAFKSSS